MTAGELASHLGLSTGATTRLIDRLEHAGYVQRTRDTVDRRRVLVEHTDARPEQLDRILASVTKPVAAVLQGLTHEQREGVAAYVRGAQHAYAEATTEIPA